MRPFHLKIIFSLLFSLLIILAVSFANFIRPFLPHLNYLLGKDSPTSYIILLGNDTEMRANAGFAGSYATASLNFPNFNLDFQDIYVPNGQLQGHVTPPAPLDQAFKHGTWVLANSDWDPDFPTSAKATRWFFDKGGEINPDILVTLNLSTIKKLLDVVGSFPVPEYKATITADNLYKFLQGKAEMNFFPGSTQKKDALYTVGRAFTKKILSLPLHQKIQIARMIYSDLVHQNILIHSTNLKFQELMEQKNFAGKLTAPEGDSYLLVEANLGANKANCCVVRETNHKIYMQGNQIRHDITLTLTNNSANENPNPPFDYSGNYVAYLRFYIPASAESIKINRQETLPANRPDIPTTATPSSTMRDNFQEIGFFHTTTAGTHSTVNISYSLPENDPKKYSLTLLKQHGLITSPQSIDLFGKTFKTPLLSDLSFFQ